MDASIIDYRDVQGLVRFGYAHLPEACFLLLRVENATAARSWLATVSLTTAERLAERPQTALQVAFTCEGLRALGVPAEIMQGICSRVHHRHGRAKKAARADSVMWGSMRRRSGYGAVPVTCRTCSSCSMPSRDGCMSGKTTVSGTLPAAGLQLLQCLDTAALDGYEPFGFKDGISSRRLIGTWSGQAGSGDQLEYSNLVAVGEFLLGYPNEYGQYTDRPFVEPRDDPHNILLPALDQPDRKDLGRNGTYLVLRQLQQDVQGFWQFLDTQAKANPTVRQKLAEAMVGRTMEGVPLVPLTDRPIRGSRTKGRGYSTQSVHLRPGQRRHPLPVWRAHSSCQSTQC